MDKELRERRTQMAPNTDARTEAAIARIKDGGGLMRVPVDATDPDVALCDLWTEVLNLRQSHAEVAAAVREELAAVADKMRYKQIAQWIREQNAPDHDATLERIRQEAIEREAQKGISGQLFERIKAQGALEEATWWEHLAQEAHDAHPPYETCMYCDRIAALEKAAGGEK